MDCATVCVGVDEFCTVLSRSLPKARKPHKCHECKELIEPGERYERVSTLYDGNFDEHKTCLGCISIRDEFFKDGYFYCGIIEAFEEHVRECSGIISESAIARLNAGGRAKVSDIIHEYWARYEDEEDD
jgi:hypothetical protein